MNEAFVQKSCTPCRGGIPSLTTEEAENFRSQVPAWDLLDDAHRIERRFRFRDFKDALSFVEQVGQVAETQGHHPDICFGWGNATVSLQTKKINGLHENDFIMASKIDKLFEYGRWADSRARSSHMTIAPTLAKHLDQRVRYDTLPHERTPTSLRAAQASHISGECLAKGVVLRRDGGYLLAVLPATHHIRLSDLREQVDDKVDLANEDEIARLFWDCVPGAVPAVGECYGLETIVDRSIDAQPEIYLEGGDHEILVHMNKDEFSKLMAGAVHSSFSAHD